MGKINITNIIDNTFGNCIKISNELIELAVTIDYGPRIIYCSLVGMENLLYQDKTKKPLGEKYDIYDGEIIKLYGGHRIWASPEIVPRCYYPDNNPVKYENCENGVIFTAPVEKINNIQKILTVTLSENEPSIIIKNTIKNCGTWNIKLSPWSITMLDKGGVEVIPQSNEPSGFLNNKVVALWPYSKMNDQRIYWGEKFITLKQNENIEAPFKLGVNNDDGWIAYFNKGQVLYKFIDTVVKGNYPDSGCSYETYTDNFMCECECLGEIQEIKPGDCADLIENWQIFKENMVSHNNEEEIESVISKYIRK